MTTLHIYGQSMPHDDVWIAGSKTTLMRLRDAIDTALQPCSSDSWIAMFANDGEGYAVHVLALHKDDEPKLAVPYSDPCYRDASGAHPSEL